MSYISDPSGDAVSVTPHDTNWVRDDAITRHVYVGGAGNMAVETEKGQSVTYNSLPVGWHPIRARIIKATGTAATNIVAHF